MPAPKNNQNAVKEDAEKASSFLYMRATPSHKASWVRAANRAKLNIAQWATEALNQAAASQPSPPEKDEKKDVANKPQNAATIR